MTPSTAWLKEVSRRIWSLGTLGVILLGNLLKGKGAIAKSQGWGTIRSGEETIRAGEGTIRVSQDFEIQKYYQNDPKFNDAYSRNDLPKTKDGAYILNLCEYKSIATHWIALHINTKKVTYFDRFEVEHIPEEIKKFIGNKNIITKSYRIQAYDSIMCGYFCIGFIDFMLKGKSLLDYANLFSPNDYEKMIKLY